MITLKDGPAAGVYDVRRAPLYLRAVIGPRGKKDVLDQLDDVPTEKESIHIYRRVKDVEVCVVFICGGSRRGSSSGPRPIADYQHIPGDGEKVRETGAWREWVAQTCGVTVDSETGQIVSE